MSTAEEHGTEVVLHEEEMEFRRPGILRYDRDQLLRLRRLKPVQQDEWWEQLLEDLGPDVAEDLRELQAVPDASQQVVRRRSKNSERRQRSKAKREALHALSINELGSDKDEQEEYESSLDPSLKHTVNENSGGRKQTGKGSRYYDPYYIEDLPEVESFQPQAFAVEGEPDFESGPPEDGWEYLRRVRHEAARCPKVVVAQIDPAKLVSEQTPYMPEIPEIPTCSAELLPSNEWEKQFLEDFSLLRMALSNILVPATFGADRLPSLRNKTAWEMRCFGSIAPVQDEDLKEMDATTETVIAEHRQEEVATQTNDPSLSSVDSVRNENGCAGNESRSELVDDGEFIERLETQIESLSNAAHACESSYVIDLGLITDYVPVNEPGESFYESSYFISGEPAQGYDDSKAWTAACSSTGLCQPEDGRDPGAKSLELQSFNVVESDQLEGSSFEIVTNFEHLSIGGPEEQHRDGEEVKPLSCIPVQSHTYSDELTTADFPGSTVDHPHAAKAELDSSSASNTPAAQPFTTDLEIAEVGSQFTRSSSNREIVENGCSETAHIETSLGGDAWALAEAELGELYSGMDSQFDYLTVGDPDAAQLEMEATLQSFSGTELPDFEYADLPSADFMDPLIGLEVFSSGNVLVDEPEESFDAGAHGTEFKIEGPLEQLFNKVFQLVGVSQLPFIHLLLRLDEVSRAALFRHHVSWLESVNGLPKDRALWLLALSAVVDMPLDSQTSAAFRALLRHCSGVRALRQSRDDEDLYLLNVLISVAGVYFGQAEVGLLSQLQSMGLRNE